MAVHFALKEKWPNVQTYTESWAVANGMAKWPLGMWEERLMRKVFREEVCG